MDRKLFNLTRTRAATGEFAWLAKNLYRHKVFPSQCASSSTQRRWRGKEVGKQLKKTHSRVLTNQKSEREEAASSRKKIINVPQKLLFTHGWCHLIMNSFQPAPVTSATETGTEWERSTSQNGAGKMKKKTKAGASEDEGNFLLAFALAN